MNRIRQWWQGFSERHLTLSQFIVFFVLSNGVTALQLGLMPILRWAFAGTSLTQVDFQVLAVGANPDGSQYFVFDFPAGELPVGGGGLAYFLAVQISLLVAQVINFFAQRNVTFKSNSSIGRAALWYALAYVIITVIAAIALGFYREPIYDLLMNTLGLGGAGETLADVITMIINAAISFWVFFPIFKVIFRQTDETAEDQGTADLARKAERGAEG